MYTIKKFALASILGLFLCGSVTPAFAGPFTVQTKINWLRSYLDGSYFVNVTSNKIAGGTCTTVYKVVSTQPGAKTVIATLLAAQASNRNIIIELDNAGCQGWGTNIISVFIY